MSRARIAWVALGVAGAGAIMGAIAGMAVTTSVAIALAVSPTHLMLLGEPPIYQLGAVFGGVSGAVLAPIAAFGFLRHVPLWRVFLEGTLGTMLTGIAGALVLDQLWAVLAVGALGFLLAEARLARAMPKPSTPATRSPAA